MVSLLEKQIGKGSIFTVYRTGIVDDSDFSDWDLIIVTNKKKTKKMCLGKNIDIRFWGREHEFIRVYSFFAYAQLQLIYGKELRPVVLDKNIEYNNLVKLSSMFFKSFLRNYYILRYRTDLTAKDVFVHLNDFVYCDFYLKDLPKGLREFIDEIKKNRSLSTDFSAAELREMVDRAIVHSWNLIDFLNGRLKNVFDIKYPRGFFAQKEPTIFVSGTVNDCRKLTESDIALNRKFKLLYLPIGFQYIFSKEDFVSGFVKFNLLCSYNSLSSLFKSFLKKFYCIFKYFEYYNFKIDKYFSPLEAYSVKAAAASYRPDAYLIDSEKAVFDYLKLNRDVKILDIGCGGGRTTFSLIKKGYLDIIGIDIEKSLIDGAKRNYNAVYSSKFLCVDLLDIDRYFDDGYFDVVFFSYQGLDYLFPLENRKKALDIMKRKVKNGGHLIFSSHNIWCFNRSYLMVFFKNIFRIFLGKKYLVVNQSFGRLLIYFSSPSVVIKDVLDSKFALVKVFKNNKFILRDPFPYYLFKKNEKISN